MKSLLSGYEFDHWESVIGGAWAEVLINNPNSLSTGITTQSGVPGGLIAYVKKEGVIGGYLNEVGYWLDGMSAWETIWSDPTGPVPVDTPNYSDRPAFAGEAIYLSGNWFNIGTVEVTGHVDLELTAPSGLKYNLTAYHNQDRTMSPNRGAAVVFNAFTLSEAGSWQIKATLSHPDGTLDEETTNFTVEAPAAGIPTTTTINIPDKTNAGETFTAYGVLYETEAVTLIPGQRINISYNGKSLGFGYTDSEGNYSIDVSIGEGGVWTIKAEFPGTETLRASNSEAKATVATTLTNTLIKIAVPAAIGIALTIYILK